MNKELLLSQIVDEKKCENLIDEMKNSSLPLVMWGCGSMSYSIRKLLKNCDITIDACWVDGAEADTFVDGIPVMGLEKIKNTYEQFNVVFGHSKYELADKILEQNLCINRCFCLVNVCYGQWKGIARTFVEEHIDEYANSYGLLEDELSRACFISYLNCKLSEDYKYVLSACKENATYFRNPFFAVTDHEDFVDIGAYTGDTVAEYLDIVNSYNNIYAIEPENESYIALEKYVNCNAIERIHLYKCGCWDTNTILRFNENEESSSIGEEGTEELEVYTLDSLLQEKKITLIKINFLSGVEETLVGATQILQKQKPNLVITVGFDEWGIIKIPQAIKRINPEYKISLRYAAAMPARLILYAY